MFEAGQNFDVFGQIFKTKIKKPKPIAVDDFFKAYPMIPLSCRSNLDGQYLLYIKGGNWVLGRGNFKPSVCLATIFLNCLSRAMSVLIFHLRK